jgi:hypothetical protein
MIRNAGSVTAASAAVNSFRHCLDARSGYLLASATFVRGRLPRLPGGRRGAKPAPTLEPVKALIHQMWRENLPADKIWSELVGRHGAAISKNTVKVCLRALRHGAIPDL